MSFSTTAMLPAVGVPANDGRNENRLVVGGKHQQRHILRVMRLTAIILLSACLTASATGHSQRVSINMKNAPVQKVFKELVKQTGVSIICNAALLDGAKPVTIKLTNATVEEVIAKCLEGLPLTYTVEGGSIIIKKKEGTKAGAVILSGDEGQAPPPIDIHGRILNENGEPVIASIIVKGTQQGTTTNSDGYFELKNVDDNATLVISGVSIESREIKLNGKNDLVIAATTKVTNMNEVVINKGYYTEQQKYSVSNVGKVTAKDIEKQPVNNPLLALEGKVPGLFINQNTGIPGGGITVRIQGQNSLQRGTDPLYIIDGVPYISQNLPDLLGPNGILGNNGNTNGASNGGGGNPLAFINPLDIESIEILKDADATSIYGSRAANGVVLITTKKAKTGQNKIDVDLQSGWGRVGHFLNLLNTQQYLEMRHEAKRNDGASVLPTDYDINGIWDTTRYTDWQKTLIGGTAKYYDGHIDFSGGSANSQFLLGAGVHRETSVFPGDLNDEKGSVQFNVNQSSTNQKFRLQFSGSYLVDNNKLMTQDLTNIAIKAPPDAPAIYNSDGTLNWQPTSTGTSTWQNPFTYTYEKYNRKANNLVYNTMLSYKILHSLQLKLELGYNNLAGSEFYKLPLSVNAPELLASSSRTSFFSNNNSESYITEPTITYSVKVKKVGINLLAGTTFQQTKSDVDQIYANGFTNDLLMEDPKSAPTVLITSTLSSKYKYSAGFGRASFKITEKYLLAFTARRDGSTRFGPENRFHNFWSIGSGWIMSNESFFKNLLPIVNFAKLRANYGTTGNDAIGDYQYLNLYKVYSVPTLYQGAVGFLPNGFFNPYLQWEETNKFQTGIDVSMLNDKISFYLNYFNNHSSNQLQPYALPVITGFNNIIENFPATVKNYGIEFSITSQNISSKNFKWTTNFTFTAPKNKLIKYENLQSSNQASFYVIGQPIPSGRLYRYGGVDPSTGVFVYYSIDNHLTTNPTAADQTILNVLLPRFFGGFQNSLSFKNFDVDILFQFTKRKGPNYKDGSSPGRFSSSASLTPVGNQPVSVLDRWQNVGDKSSIEKFSTTYNSAIFGSAQNLIGPSTFTYSDASYCRLKNLSISYLLPPEISRRIHFQNFKVFLHGQNLLTFTKYIGLDPETLSFTSLPTLRIITVGVSAAF